ncbi:MAG: hypothetical protein DRR15_10145, partial [Gammaproteobacteria bacterium]
GMLKTCPAMFVARWAGSYDRFLQFLVIGVRGTVTLSSFEGTGDRVTVPLTEEDKVTVPLIR